MALLAGPKRKQKLGLDPNNTNWANDTSAIGQSLLKKMGWTEGAGLGANEDGIVVPVKATMKSDNRGLGCTAQQADAWIAHQEEFDEILAALNSSSSNNSEKETSKSDSQNSATKNKPKEGEKRFYGRFARGGVKSLRTTEDLDCILGRRKASAKTEVKEEVKVEEKEVNEASADDSKNTDTDKNHGFVTVTSTCSVQDYFAQKMKKKNSEESVVKQEEEGEKEWKPKINDSFTTRDCTVQDYFSQKMRAMKERKAAKMATETETSTDHTVQQSVAESSERIEDVSVVNDSKEMNNEEIKKKKDNRKKYEADDCSDVKKELQQDDDSVNELVKNDTDNKKKNNKKKKKGGTDKFKESSDDAAIEVECGIPQSENKEVKEKKKKKSKKRKVSEADANESKDIENKDSGSDCGETMKKRLKLDCDTESEAGVLPLSEEQTENNVINTDVEGKSNGKRKGRVSEVNAKKKEKYQLKQKVLSKIQPKLVFEHEAAAKKIEALNVDPTLNELSASLRRELRSKLIEKRVLERAEHDPKRLKKGKKIDKSIKGLKGVSVEKATEAKDKFEKEIESIKLEECKKLKIQLKERTKAINKLANEYKNDISLHTKCISQLEVLKSNAKIAKSHLKDAAKQVIKENDTRFQEFLQIVGNLVQDISEKLDKHTSDPEESSSVFPGAIDVKGYLK